MIVSHKTNYADAVAWLTEMTKPAFAIQYDDISTARVKGGFGLGLC